MAKYFVHVDGVLVHEFYVPGDTYSARVTVAAAPELIYGLDYKIDRSGSTGRFMGYNNENLPVFAVTSRYSASRVAFRFIAKSQMDQIESLAPPYVSQNAAPFKVVRTE